jgi:hypothetical protein
VRHQCIPSTVSRCMEVSDALHAWASPGHREAIEAHLASGDGGGVRARVH